MSDDEQRMVELGAKLTSNKQQPVTEESKAAAKRIAEMARENLIEIGGSNE